MKFQTFLVTLYITLLTACAVEKNEDAQVAADPSPQGKAEVHIRELTDQTGNSGQTAVPTTMPLEEKMQGNTAVVLRRDRLLQVTEQDTTAVAKHAANGQMMVMQQSRHPASVASAGLIQNSLRHGYEPIYRENYQHPESQNVMRVASDPVSTFSIDVDSGAYSNMRRWLNQGQLPPEDAVRVEEFINYFGYDYPSPQNQQQPFQVSTAMAPTPWNPDTRLLRIGIQGYEVPKSQLPPSNLVFLIDVSGSMNSADKLPLLQQALSMLVGQLDARDSISMVVYAGASGVVLPPTHGNRKADILTALQQLSAGGSTNGAAGIQLAYQMAQQGFIKNGINRVILATDGDFNVGLASTEELIDLIQRKRDAGIALTTLGFGSGNYNDHLLEQLADEGNGNYAYIDRLHEAKKVLSDELSSTLLTIAKDVKIQLEFNPDQVSEYRLIGYDNRVLNEEDFANDKVDAGEIGAGHRVTALYEISLAGSSGQRLPPRRYRSHAAVNAEPDADFTNELAHLRIRYKLPNENTSQLIESPIMHNARSTQVDANFNFAAAVAAFGQKLRGGKYLGDYHYDDIAQLARQSRGSDPHGYRSEFMQLVELAGTLTKTDSVALHD